VHRLPKHYQEVENLINNERNDVALLRDIGRISYFHENSQFIMIHQSFVFIGTQRGMYNWKRRFHLFLSPQQIHLPPQEYPILPEYCPEQDQGLWGGEGVVKGYYESKPYTKKKILPRQWIPRLWFPLLRIQVFYSEVLEIYLKITVTNRISRIIDKHCGLDLYLLETPDIDINSKIGMDLKRFILIRLAKQVLKSINSRLMEHHFY
jgi:ribosomal protein L28